MKEKNFGEWNKKNKINVDCSDNELTSLVGAPKKVGGNFYCSHNKLTSLKGAPKEVGGNFYCYSNELTSLKGAPKEVGGNFECYSNEKRFKIEDVRKFCDVKGKIIFYLN